MNECGLFFFESGRECDDSDVEAYADLMSTYKYDFGDEDETGEPVGEVYAYMEEDIEALGDADLFIDELLFTNDLLEINFIKHRINIFCFLRIFFNRSLNNIKTSQSDNVFFVS